MSLVRLLTVGRSLDGLNETQSPYRLSQRGLPKFNLETKPRFAETQKLGINQGTPSKPSKIGCEVMRQTKPAVIREGKFSWSFGNFFHACLQVISPNLRRLAELNPFAAKRRGVFTLQSRKTSTAAVQTELSLEKVKVLRNDLCDADLEVVPLKSSKQPAATHSAPNLKFGRWIGDFLKSEETKVH